MIKPNNMAKEPFDVINQFINLVLNVAYLFRFKNIKLNKESFKFQFSFAGMLAFLGIASCLNTMTSTIIAIVSNNMLTHYGALSAHGEDIPILGFNYGAEKFDRVKKTFSLTLISTTVVMAVAWVVYIPYISV